MLGLVLTLVVACTHRDWRRARAQDTAASYHHFLREHPASGHAREARARLDLVRLRNRPTLEGFQAFAEKYADLGLVDELRPHVESAFFDQARRLGTAAAYEAFLADFRGGAFETRAIGNAEYLRNEGFGGDVAQLAIFAERFPDSDFAAEAKRSVASIRQRAELAFRRTHLIIEIDPATPGADRLRRVFQERAVERFRAAGLELVPTSAPSRPFDSVLRIAHREGQIQANLRQNTMTESGILAETQVTLQRPEDDAPIWQDVFTYRAPFSARKTDESILFGAGAETYWARFFVPVATWQTRAVLRNSWRLPEPPVAVDVAGGRAVVLFGDGSFQLLTLADPLQPALLAEYRRPRDLARFEGVALLGDRVAVFGPDGLEIVALDGASPTREHVWPRDRIGSPTAVVATRSGLALAGTRGLSWIANASQDVTVLVPRQTLALESVDDHLIFTDGVRLYSATPAQLEEGRVASELRLGTGFAPRAVRINGRQAIVIGERVVVSVDVAEGGRLVTRSRLDLAETGQVRDGLSLSNRIFLLGDRGLQVADRTRERVVDSIDVTVRERMAVDSRHLVLIGEQTLEVVDATPFVASMPAAPRASPQ